MDNDALPVDPDVVVLFSPIAPLGSNSITIEIRRDGTTFISDLLMEDQVETEALTRHTVDRVVAAFLSRGFAAMPRAYGDSHDTDALPYRLILNAHCVWKRVWAATSDPATKAVLDLVGDFERIVPVDAWLERFNAAAKARHFREMNEREASAATRGER